MVVRKLPKLERRVRFPYPAPGLFRLPLLRKALARRSVLWYTIEMSSKRIFTGLLLVIFPVLVFVSSVPVVLAQPKQGEIKLLEPISGGKTITASPGAGTFIEYFNRASNWILAVAVGFCVIWVLIGGFMIMVSGSDSGMRSKGQDHIKWALIGLVMLMFAGFILRTLNSMFFK